MQAAGREARVEIKYGEDEALLAQSASEWLAKHCDIASVRRLMSTPSGYDAALFHQMAELGWLGVAVPAAYGGAGMHVGALVSLAEPMGRQLMASPFLATTLAAQLLLAAGNATQKARLLPELVSGAAIGSIALSEPSGSYELLPVKTRATRNASGGFTLAGEKTFVLDAEHADFVIVSALHDAQPVLLLVEAAALAGRMRRETLIDETRRSARITLDGVNVGGEALLDGADASQALAHTERVAWLLLAAEMAGGTEASMQLTLDYLKTRKQFGKLIGGYQALKHPMVEIMCALEQGRSLLYHAATAMDGEPTEREIALRMAKAQLGDTFTHATDRSIQFHGAIGFTYECHAQLYFRRAQWSQYAFGDALHHRRKLSERLWRGDTLA